MEKKHGKYTRLGQYRGEGQFEYHSFNFTQRRHYSRGLEDAWGPSAIKGWYLL